MARQDHAPVSEEEKQHFLDQIANGASIVAAAGNEAMRRKFYRRRDPDESCYDEDFAKAWDEAVKIHRRDYLVHIAQSRFVDGWDEPVFYKGEQIGTIRRFDNTIGMFLIKQADPSFRGNHKIEVTGKNDGPVQIEHRGVKLADILSAARDVGLTD